MVFYEDVKNISKIFYEIVDFWENFVEFLKNFISFLRMGIVFREFEVFEVK